MVTKKAKFKTNKQTNKTNKYQGCYRIVWQCSNYAAPPS